MPEADETDSNPWKAVNFAGATAMRAHHARAMTIPERFQWLDERDALCRFQARQQG